MRWWINRTGRLGGRKVDFVVAGCQKGGTTALDVYLREHPEICMANVKEVHFFDDDRYFQSEITDYSAYHAHFRPKRRHKLLGETTPAYMWWPSAPERIWRYNPDMKLIVLLRNPIDRAYSSWNMEVARGNEDLPFLEAIKAEQQRRQAIPPSQRKHFSYLSRGFYGQQLGEIWKHFSREQLLVLKSESLRDEAQVVMDGVFRFLGVRSAEIVIPRSVHKGVYARLKGNVERECLKQIHEPEIREVEKMLGWDCSNWLA